MKIEFSSSGVLLAKGQTLSLPDAAGVRVGSQSGIVWITQDGDPRDIVLAPGDSFTFDQRGDALISALDDARFLLLETCAPARAH